MIIKRNTVPASPLERVWAKYWEEQGVERRSSRWRTASVRARWVGVLALILGGFAVGQAPPSEAPVVEDIPPTVAPLAPFEITAGLTGR